MSVQRAFIYQEVDLAKDSALCFRDAPGVEVRGETSALWLTVNGRWHAFPDVGSAYRIHAMGTTRVFAFRPTRVVLAGEVQSARPWRIEFVRSHSRVVVLAEATVSVPESADTDFTPLLRIAKRVVARVSVFVRRAIDSEVWRYRARTPK
jgi:hypothetical protein